MNTEGVLFIVNSPFQCLCMFEAIHHFSIKEYDVVLRPDSSELNNQMVIRILEEKRIPFKVGKMSPLVSGLLPYLFKNNKKYSVLFNGDYYSGGLCAYAYSLICAKRKAKIVYFDDGVETLRVFSKPPLKRYNNWRVWIVMKFYETLKLLKGIGKPYYFTVFNVNSPKFVIKKNSLSTLRQKMKETQPSGAYIIGTNFDGVDVDKEDYFALLGNLINYCRKHYPNEPILYCPHRRNKDNAELINYLETEKVCMFDTKISVEYDFVQRGISPVYVSGFGSTALYTLKIIFPQATVDNVCLRLKTQTAAISAFDKLYEVQCREIGVGQIDLYKK